jgi:outer membrane protein OmpA-like peptidoglycan-associated protein
MVRCSGAGGVTIRRGLLFLTMWSLSAAADPGIDAQQFHPAPGSNSYISVNGAFPSEHLTLDAGVYINWAHQPLTVVRGNQTGVVIGDQLGLDVLIGFSIINRLELVVVLPATFNATTDNTLLKFAGGLDGAGLGDLMLDFSALVLDAHPGGHRVGLAIAMGVSAPTGDTQAFASQGGWTGRPRLVFEWRLPNDAFGVAAEVGAVLRGERQLGVLDVTHQISYGLGARVNLTHGLTSLIEARGLVNAASDVQSPQAPFELAFGLRWRSSFGLQLEAAGTVGLTQGYGTPDGRFIFGIRYLASLRRSGPKVFEDRDKDGVADDFDRCPDAPGPMDNNGCPVPDKDGDGVEDTLDHCPDQPGPMANMGCPDFDSDLDGVPDREDRCPEMPGPAKNRGCPDDDKDQDGVPDAKDRCPDQRGSPANDGCPDVDSDGDGIVDRLDKCPFDPEVFNGVADDDGCPDPGPALAELTEDKIVLKEQIAFSGKNRIETRSHRVLAVIAKLMELHPEILRVRIEGHTDNKGSAIDNLDLSRERAAAVRRHLIDIGGIDGKRLVAQGFGPDRPVGDNKTEAGRAKNRRIELVIIEKSQAN